MSIREEARQEAERRWPVEEKTTMAWAGRRIGFEEGAVWAREQDTREPSDADLTQDELATLEWCVSHVIEKSRFSQLRIGERVVTFTDLREKIRVLTAAQ